MSANAPSNRVNWFEIPVADLKRAVIFYSTVLQTELHPEAMGEAHMAVFDKADGIVTGALVQGEHWQPSATGTVVYLNAGDDLNTPLGRIAAAGGEVLVPKTFIGQDCGYYAVFKDSEGNSVGLHSLH